MKIAVVGSGSFGTAVSYMLRVKGLDVSLWCHSESVAKEINANGRNPKHMCDCNLNGVVASTSFASVFDNAEAVILATPSFAVADVTEKMAPFLPSDIPVLLLSKGIAADGSLLFETVANKVGNIDRVAVLSGPNHAEELAIGKFAGAVVASTSEETAKTLQQIVSNMNFRLYTSNDPIGVSLCGAVKNVIAIVCGCARGANAGDNAISLLMTRGLAELARLVTACGGDSLTCLGLAGVGDMNATCNSRHSRNGMFGEALATEGCSFEEYEASHHAVVEGAHAVVPLYKLAHEKGVEMPITEAVYSILYENAELEPTIYGLFTRSLKAE